jgi:hypothetical protein
MSYIYGASVQGIQGFIFETNKLKEIAGASSLVDEICTTFFRDFLGADYDEQNLILGAAGNIKYIFDNKESCVNMMRKFPRAVMKKAPGITISQAAVELTGNSADCISTLEARLRIQRNKSISQHGLGMMISERSRRTGKPSVSKEKDRDGNWNFLDAGQKAKIANAGAANNSLIRKISDDDGLDKFPLDTDEIIQHSKNSWIAIIHADANNLGNKIMAMSTGNNHNLTQDLKTMSARIESATIKAAKRAFEEVIIPATSPNERYPFRPIIIGGDDLTVIVRGDLALTFTHQYLQFFEEETQQALNDAGLTYFKQGLSACAGIAYIKSGYPFHYGVSLAEELCAQAKKVSKALNADHTPSSLLFHKVHASFIEDYADIVNREKIHGNYSFEYGPYFLREQSSQDTIDKLIEHIHILNEKGSPKSRLRNWLTTIKHNPGAALQDMRRIIDVTQGKYVESLKLEPLRKMCEGQNTPKRIYLYDAISLSNIEKPA